MLLLSFIHCTIYVRENNRTYEYFNSTNTFKNCVLRIKQETKLFICETYYVHIRNDAGKYNENKFILDVYLSIH